MHTHEYKYRSAYSSRCTYRYIHRYSHIHTYTYTGILELGAWIRHVKCSQACDPITASFAYVWAVALHSGCRNHRLNPRQVSVCYRQFLLAARVWQASVFSVTGKLDWIDCFFFLFPAGLMAFCSSQVSHRTVLSGWRRVRACAPNAQQAPQDHQQP